MGIEGALAPNSFDQKMEPWLEHQTAPWSRLMYGISQAHLQRHLSGLGQNLSILDAGGGNGLDAILLARQGHRVTLLDSSAEMLAEAQRGAEAAGVAPQIEFCRAPLIDLPHLFPEQRFDAVVCHSVAHYVKDAVALLTALGAPLREGGLLSLISINRYSEAFRAAVMWQDLDAALGILDAETTHSALFDTSIELRTASEFVEWLSSMGFTVLGQYGIRCVNDYIADNEIKHDPDFFHKLMHLELELSSRFPYYLLARHFQIVAQKSGHPPQSRQGAQ